ncbi:MAG: hypothetical protein AAF773_05425 [Cyanobacteria bacterium P01_D01_bin.115]
MSAPESRRSSSPRLVESVNRLSIKVNALERTEESRSARVNDIAADAVDIITACIKLAIKILKPVSEQHVRLKLPVLNSGN